VVRVAGARDKDRLAIRPYPAELETRIMIKDGQAFDVRPIRPEDAGALVAMSRLTSPDDLRLRFFSAMSSLPDWMAARLSQTDYDREIALVAIDRAGDFVGVMRLIRDPDNRRAEFAIIVRTDLKGHGLGHALMLAMLDLARARGVASVEGDILPENTTMLRMVRELGGTTAPNAEAHTVRARFDLTRPA
jgi:acetyltransferase